MDTPLPRKPYLTSLLIYVTGRCNLKCRHCYYAPSYESQRSTHSDEISREQIAGAVETLLPFGLRSCKLSGGEPFLRDDLTGIGRDLDSKKIRILIETNGTLVTKQEAETLGQMTIRPFVSVSIDGAQAESHEALRGVPGCFQRTIEGLRYLVQASVDTQVIAAAHADNKGELTRIMDIAAGMGVGSFKICFASPIGRAKSLPLLGLEESLEIDNALARHAQSAGIRYCSSLPLAFKSVKCIMDTCALNDRCNITSTLGLLADGTITICGMGRYASDFRFGRLGQDNIATVWESHPTLTLIREGLPQHLRGICGRCIARSTCLGFCRLESEQTTADSVFEPFSKCAELERLGLFPKSRVLERLEPKAINVA